MLSELLCVGQCDNVHSQQHSYVSSSYRSNRFGLSHWHSYSCIEAVA